MQNLEFENQGEKRDYSGAAGRRAKGQEAVSEGMKNFAAQVQVETDTLEESVASIIVARPQFLSGHYTAYPDGVWLSTEQRKEARDGYYRWYRPGEKIIRALGNGLVVVEPNDTLVPYSLGQLKEETLPRILAALVPELTGKTDMNYKYLIPRARQLCGAYCRPWIGFEEDIIDHFEVNGPSKLLSYVIRKGCTTEDMLMSKQLKQVANSGVNSSLWNEFVKYKKQTMHFSASDKRSWCIKAVRRLILAPACLFVIILFIASLINYVEVQTIVVNISFLFILVCISIFAWCRAGHSLAFVLYRMDVTTDQPRVLTLANTVSVLRSCSQGVSLPEPSQRATLSIKEGETLFTHPCDSKDMQVYGCTIDGAALAAPLGCHHDQYNGLRIRFLFDRTIDTVVERDFVDSSKIFLHNKKQFGVFPTIGKDEWLEHLTGPRRRLLEESLPISKMISEIPVDIFVKNEIYVGKTPDAFKPRIIMGRRAPLQYAIGEYFFAMSKFVASMFKEGNFLYDNGFDACKLGHLALRCFEYKHVYEVDVSNFDGSVSNQMLLLERWFVSTFPDRPAEVNQMLQHWTKVSGYGKRGLEFSCDWGRRSGDMWTSSFNSLLNLCISNFVFGDGLFIAKGDDGYLGTNSDISVPEIIELYSQLGMTVKIKEVHHISELGYCSGSFYPIEDGYKWGVNPFRILSKFGVNYHHHPSKNLPGLLKGTVISMLPICGHVPLLGGLFDSLSKSDLIAILPKEQPWKTSSSFVHQVTPDAIEFFLSKYGWSLEDYLQVTEVFSNLKIEDFPLVLTNPLFHRGFSIDSGNDVFCEASYTKRDEPTISTPAMAWDFAELLSPLIEEAIKSVSFIGMFLIILIECYGHRSVFPFFIHTGLVVLFPNFFVRVVMHYLYNSLLANFVDGNLIGCYRKNYVITKNNSNKSGSKRKTSRAIKAMVRQMAKAAIIDASSGIGGVAGGYLGNSRQGSRYGKKAGAWLSKVSGMGDYHINANSLVKGNSVPVFSRNGRGVRIAHREFLGDIESGTTFVSTEFALNPGLSTSFPWLSSIAQNFQQYEFHGLLFEFKSTSAVALASTNTALGVNILATQYNSLDNSFINKVEMENYEYSTSACPAESMIHPIECAPFEKSVRMQYVRNGAVPSGEDARFYDLGRTTIASVGAQQASICGELWVTYDVEFFKPRLVAGSYTSQFAHYPNGAYTNTNILSSVITSNSGNLALSITATGSGYDTINFPVNVQSGYYYVGLAWRGSSTAGLALTTTETNCERLQVYAQDTSDKESNSSTTSATYIYEFVVLVSAREAKIVLSAATLPTSGATCTINVFQIGNPL